MYTGHSLGAGISILLAFLLRPRYPFLKVYAFATPGTNPWKIIFFIYILWFITEFLI